MADKIPPRKGLKKVTLKTRGPTHRGPIGKAKLLTPEQFEEAADKANDRSMYASRDKLFIMLSRFCGLRAQEIAKIHYEDFTDVKGVVINDLHISKRGAKYGKERTVVLRKEVKEALEEYCKRADINEGPIFWSQRGTPASSNLVQKQLKGLYVACGFKGARSHTGRRYAITTMAQKANLVGASLEDVRHFAGHSNLSTTATYIDKSPYADKLVGFL